jgi:hypothetical protein
MLKSQNALGRTVKQQWCVALTPWNRPFRGFLCSLKAMERCGVDVWLGGAIVLFPRKRLVRFA